MLMRDEFDPAYDTEVRCDQCGDRIAPAYLEPGTPICKWCWAYLEEEEQKRLQDQMER